MRRIAYAKHKHVISGILNHLKSQNLGRLLRDDGQPNTQIIEKLFDKIDENSDGHLSASELRAFVLGVQFQVIDLDKDDAVDRVLKEFDTSANNFVEKDEFVAGISKWLHVAKGGRASNDDRDPHAMKFISDFHKASCLKITQCYIYAFTAEDMNDILKFAANEKRA